MTGYLLKEGTEVDTTVIAAPGSTKSQSGERPPGTHQSKKSNQWHFGMKLHVRPESRLDFCLTQRHARCDDS